MTKLFFNKTTRYLFVLGLIGLIMAFRSSEGTSKYKCMIQMVNYMGENAYVVISLMNPDNSYQKTLYVAGKDDEWYHDLIKWWKHQKTAKDPLDGITGASIAGGQRSVALLSIPSDKLDKGYLLRFESAVEGQVYHHNDIEIPLIHSNIDKKIEGKGYIRYIRLMASK